MDYVELNLPAADDERAEILTAELAEYPFESFRSEEGVLKAYIPGELLAGCRSEVDAMLAGYGIGSPHYVTIGTQNWNARWESGFTPVDIDGRILIRAPFHAPAPDGVLEIIVTPRMAFGSGHHATTALMASAVLDLGLRGARVLDMGCGTGVLAIAAARCGAAHVDAVDIDDWAYRNCCENAAANGVSDRIEPIRGDVRSVAGRRYGFILANINRNILMADMAAYASLLAPGGTLVMSGFLPEDIPAVTTAAAMQGLADAGSRLRDGWACVRCTKP